MPSSRFVLTLSLGPVQGFIAAARRSRDLWSGSWLLSEISKASAKALHDAGAALVFPAPKTEADLAPNTIFSVGNKIQAVIEATDATAVATLADRSKQAARDRFKAIAEQAKAKLKNDEALRQTIWDRQVDDYVEAYAAWARIGDAGYAAAAEASARALAARKATRDFSPSATAQDEAIFLLPKSSLDGARETVLVDGKTGNTVRRKLGLAENEQLDCAGIVKRLGGDSEQFTPFSRIAAHAWLGSLDQDARDRIAQAYEPLVGLGLATRVCGNAQAFIDFPYDAQLCYRFRLDAALRDARGQADEEKALRNLQSCLRDVWRIAGEPCPYGVILLADGDKMGALLNEAKDQAAHISITQALSAFADGVAGRVRQFSGHAIYAGGDDVLAFLPLNQAYACADQLQKDFAAKLQPIANELGAENKPTLSVGLAIGHMLEPFGNLRALASQAEKTAKGDHCGDAKRNALGICLAVRSGATVSLRLRWDDLPGHAAFQQWIVAFQNKTLPSRMAYDTRAVHMRSSFATTGDNPQPGIQVAEFARTLDRARTTGGEKLDDAIKALLIQRAGPVGLNTLANELIAARWLAARNKRDLGDER